MTSKKQRVANDLSPTRGADNSSLIRRHLVFGWLGLVVFMSLGLALEVLHGLKIDYYLDLRNSTRRLLWTLAHTHGTVFSLVNIAFAWTLTQLVHGSLLPWASIALLTAQWIMPLGFFAGGIWLLSGDPGYGILLAPVGGVFIILGAAIVLLRLLAESR